MDNLTAARVMMALTLSWHIVLASLGVGMPVLLLAAEGQYLRSGDPLWRTLARRWSKAFAVLFAVGAVSGTVLSFELGLLWPQFMERFGSVIGLPFTLEGFAFFLEGIFVGIYLYGWERLGPRAHLASAIPIALSGGASAWFVVTVNAWMNTPRGFRLTDGRATDIEPVAAMLNPATGAETAHMIVAAYMVTGFLVAGYYAACRLGGTDTNYTRRAMRTALWLGVACAPIQFVVGDWAARTVAQTQPAKLAAMEAQFRTERSAPLRIGGWPSEREGTTRYAIKIPGGLSLLAYHDINAVVTGLDDFPPDERPPLAPVHLSFQLMVAMGSALLGLSAWTIGRTLWRRQLPDGKLYLACVALAGPAVVVALESGWMVTEIGRQPWIVHGTMRTAEAVTQAPGIGAVLGATIAVYAILTVSTVAVLRLLGRLPLEESDR